jgi:hypothetical protein
MKEIKTHRNRPLKNFIYEETSRRVCHEEARRRNEKEAISYQLSAFSGQKSVGLTEG